MTDGRSDEAELALWRRQRWVASGLASPTARVPATDPSAPRSRRTVAGERTTARPIPVAEEIKRQGCVQAQDFDMTLWSLAQRVGGARDDVLAALAAGEVVRTHAMRPTWHFMHRDDLVSVQVATAERVHPMLRPMLRTQGIDDAALAAWRSWLGVQLADGPLTRAELQSRLPKDEMDFDGFTLGLVLMWAELELVVGSGPPRGMTHTYALLEGGPRPAREDAIRQLVARFLASHGPSMIGDVAAWSGLTRREISRALGELDDQVCRAELAGDRRFWIGSVTDEPWDEPVVELLNAYDEYVSGLEARSKLLLDPDRLYRERRGTPVAMVVVDGTLLGHWRRTTRGSGVSVQVLPLRPLAAAELAGLEAAVERYGRFAGQPATLDLITV